MVKEIRKILAAEIEMMGGPMTIGEMMGTLGEAGYRACTVYHTVIAETKILVIGANGAPLRVLTAETVRAWEKPAPVMKGAPAPWA